MQGPQERHRLRQSTFELLAHALKRQWTYQDVKQNKQDILDDHYYALHDKNGIKERTSNIKKYRTEFFKLTI